MTTIPSHTIDALIANLAHENWFEIVTLLIDAHLDVEFRALCTLFGIGGGA